MGSNEFIGSFASYLLPFLLGLISLITPVIKLNSNIVKLESTLSRIDKDNGRRDIQIEKLIHDLDDLKNKSTEHEVLIQEIQRRLKEAVRKTT